MHIHTLPLVVVSPSIFDIAPHVLRLPVALMSTIRAYPTAERLQRYRYMDLAVW